MVSFRCFLCAHKASRRRKLAFFYAFLYSKIVKISALAHQGRHCEGITIMAVLLIPAYRPEEGMLEFVTKVQASGRFTSIVAVDDGGGADYAEIFARLTQMGVEVVTHAVNLGKGQAMKTGFNHILLHHPGEDVVTADCDGQHSVPDTVRVADVLDTITEVDSLVLGSRKLDKNTPWKSRVGNGITRFAFFLATGFKVYDTQTGLRGFPAGLLPRLMEIPGSRYEYEMNMLLSFAREGFQIVEIPIETIYIHNNAGTHFNPVRDAFRVFSRLFVFAASSFFCYGVDYALYALLLAMGLLPLYACYALARLVSSTLNFYLNRKLVFKAEDSPLIGQLIRYYLLAVVVLVLGALLVQGFTHLGISKYIAKPLADILLYILSFVGQRMLVFKPGVVKRHS